MKKTTLDHHVAPDPKTGGWMEATIQFLQADQESLSEFVAECMDQGAVGSAEDPVYLKDDLDGSSICEACGKSVRQNIFFPDSMGMEEILGLLETKISCFFNRLPDFGARVLQCRRIQREAWATDWMNSFPPERIGVRLWTVPTWEHPPLPQDAIPIVMEPGLAFGTGKHATTRHCLQFLEEIASDNKRLPPSFLDVGCGSAILSIAAAFLGAEKILALEIDPDSVSVAAKNLEQNGLRGRVRLVNGPLECCRGHFELIAANLTATVLSGYSCLLPSLLAEGGLCILSGILLPEKPGILERYGESGMDPLQEKWDEDEGWSTLVFRKTRRT
jgi:ribosomal protein L11 methyltransferase